MSVGLFIGIKYYTIGNIKDEIIDKLDKGGAKRVNYLTGLVTHVIAEDDDDPEVEEACDIYETNVINSEWVLMSIHCEKLLPIQPFSPSKVKLFSGVTAFFSIPPNDDSFPSDHNILWALLTYYGASVVKECQATPITHIISYDPDIELSTFGPKDGPITENVSVVTPDWVEDSVRGKKMVDSKIYDPKFLKKPVVLEEKNEPILVNIKSPTKTSIADVVSNLQKHIDERVTSLASSSDDIVSNAPKRNQGTAPIPPPTPTVPQKDVATVPKYYGYAPDVAVPPDLCLMGCVFYIDEYQALLPSPQIESWKKVIAMLGGEVETSLSPKCTHLISSSKSVLFHKALSQGIRCVSAHWLNDCVAIKKMVPPWKPLHVPAPFSSHPGAKHVVSITNFLGEERAQVRQLLWRIGAKYTGNLNQTNTLLISRSEDGPKVKKAKEWHIPIVNLSWLLDCILVDEEKRGLPDITDLKYTNLKYPLPKSASSKSRLADVSDTLANNDGRSDAEFFLDHSRVIDIMEPWKVGLSLDPAEIAKRISLAHDQTLLPPNATNNGANKVVNPNDHIPTCEEVDARTGETRSVGAKSHAPSERVDPKLSPDQGTKESSTGGGESLTYQSHLLPLQKKRLLLAANSVSKKMATVTISDVTNSTNSASNPSTNASSDKNSSNSNQNGPTNSNNSPSVHTPHGSHGNQGSTVVMITGVPKSSSLPLGKKILELGGQLTDNPLLCSHVVMESVKRTIKFFCAFSHCKHILTPKWILDSHKSNKFLPEDDYILHDKEAQNLFNFCLKTSLYRAQHRDPLFQSMNFYLTSKVEPAPAILKPIIESAGGTIIKQRPSARQVNLQNKEKIKCVIISCPDDLPLCKDYISQNINIHNVELILTGLLQQNSNFEQFKVQPLKENIK